MQTPFELDNWERGALNELYREYLSVLRDKRLLMKPAAIALFDSNTHWGRWNPLTRTILLSRQLVLKHPWFQVVGILRHEMAHQLVDHEATPAIDPAPHGEIFREACRRVGVPEEFAKASAGLRESGLDWREEKRDENSEKLLDKVRKLLALATSSNEHEALLAMNKVRLLYAKYNLEHAAEAANYAHIVINHGKKRIEAHQDKIIGILVGHFFVRVLTFNTYDPPTGQRHRAIEIIGTRENALMAEYVYHFLIQQTDFWVREASKLKTLSRVARKSYRLGILEGFADKLTRPKPAATEAGPIATPNVSATDIAVLETAVAHFKKDKRLDLYLSEIYPRLATRSQTYAGVEAAAFHAGVAVGKTLTLNRAVSSRAGNAGRLLT